MGKHDSALTGNMSSMSGRSGVIAARGGHTNISLTNLLTVWIVFLFRTLLKNILDILAVYLSYNYVNT